MGFYFDLTPFEIRLGPMAVDITKLKKHQAIMTPQGLGYWIEENYIAFKGDGPGRTYIGSWTSSDWLRLSIEAGYYYASMFDPKKAFIWKPYKIKF